MGLTSKGDNNLLLFPKGLRWTIDECCPKFFGKERIENGVHVAPRRQVST